MNIIFHRNCLDGVFSSFIAYLATKLITEDQLNNLIQSIKQSLCRGIADLTNLLTTTKSTQNKSKFVDINEQFFHTSSGVYFNAYSFYAGEYYPLKFPVKTKLLLILDTNLASLQNIEDICKNNELVLMIDHHTSFKNIKQKFVNSTLPKNFAYVFNQQYSASILTFNFFNLFFRLDEKLTQKYLHSLKTQLLYVCANDTKNNQTQQSKCYILGFYYFQIELSHINPNLYKRIGMMDLQYLLQRGKNQYESHLDIIKDQLKQAKVIQFIFKNQRFKNKMCLYIEPNHPQKVSDIGNVLAFISAQRQMLNLCVIAMKKSDQIRISCRSHKKCKEPMALELAQIFGGGGHSEAAGCKITNNIFRSNFKVHSLNKYGINIQMDLQQIQNILLGNSS